MSFKSKLQYENPLDLLFYKIGDVISPIFYALNLTANHLTIIGLLLGLLSVVLVYGIVKNFHLVENFKAFGIGLRAIAVDSTFKHITIQITLPRIYKFSKNCHQQ